MPEEVSVNAPDESVMTLESSSLGSSAFGAATFLSRGLRWGLVTGAVIGGLGGRLAMLVLRLTSDGSLHGVKTNDGFVIGRFSRETLFLVVFAAQLGAVGGLVYLLIREWLPRNWRAAAFGVLCATMVGAAIISPDGADFTLLSPLWLAIAMFVLIPAAYGAVVSVLVERSIRLGHVRQGGWRWLALLPLGLLIVFPLFALVGIVVFAVAIYANRSGRAAELWRSGPVTWLGRLAVAMGFLLSGVTLVRDVSEVLS
jgi:hypothetical protein